MVHTRLFLLELCVICEALTRGLVSTDSWQEAPKLLKNREVSAVFVRNAAAVEDAGWESAADGTAFAAVDVDDRSRSILALTDALGVFWETDDISTRIAPKLFDLARCYDPCLGERRDGMVRVRLDVARGRATAKCPKFHTDNVALRCLVSLKGPPTVVAPTVDLSGSRVLPSWVARDANADAETVAPNAGDALLLKGEKWGFFSAAAAHRSPEFTPERRVLLCLDRLSDVT